METTGLKHIDELVRRAIIGDGTAFTMLWDTYAPALRQFLRATIKNIDDFYVDDISSRSFEKAFRQIGSFDPNRSQFFTWLKVIARNTALDTLDQESRSQKLCVHIEDGADVEYVNNISDENAASPLDTIIKDEYETRTQHYIDMLPSLYREVARHRMIEGMQYKEISEEMHMELNTVRTRIRRAKALIEKYKSEENDVQ